MKFQTEKKSKRNELFDTPEKPLKKLKTQTFLCDKEN